MPGKLWMPSAGTTAPCVISEVTGAGNDAGALPVPYGCYGGHRVSGRWGARLGGRFLFWWAWCGVALCGTALVGMRRAGGWNVTDPVGKQAWGLPGLGCCGAVVPARSG